MLCGWISLLLALSGPVYRGVESNVRVAVPRSDASIAVDGRLDEPVWSEAAQLAGFSQYAPDDGRPARHETQVLVWYSPSAIHFGIRAHAEPGSVRATLADRDRIDNDDWVQILLATFNDGRQATVLGVNPLGVQMDGTVVEGASSSSRGFGGLAVGRPAPDLSPDFVFESAGRLTAEGYEVELRVPFKSLRYQSADVQEWGLHVVRRVQSTGHEDSWAPARRSAATFLGQAGTLAGLRGLQRGLVMDLNPAVVTRSDGQRAGSGWSYDAQRPDAGGNLRWGVTPNLTVNATLNPDFSQVEADATQFQVDPRQALFFAEKRPFFLDGVEFFTTPGNLVYSRRIVDPVAAVKATGKLAGTSLAALTAVDAGSQSIASARPVFTIVRVQRDFGAASRAGLLYTNRMDGAAANHVAGVDARLVWRGIYSMDLQVAASHTASPAAASRAGALWQAGLRRTGRRFSARYALSGNDAEFHTASGFISRQNVVNGEVTHQVALYGAPGALIERWTGDARLLGTWNHARFFDGGPALEKKLHLSSNVLTRGGWRSGFSILVERFDFDPDAYANYRLLDGTMLRPFTGPALPNLDYVVSLDSPRIRGVSVNLFYLWGRDENFAEWSSADIMWLTSGLQWRPSERLRIDANYNLQSFQRRTDGSLVEIRRVPRLKVEYQATRAIFVRYVGEYASSFRDALRDDSRTELPIVFVRPDGTYVAQPASRRRSYRHDWLFSYQPTPGTVLFAGYGNVLANADPLDTRRMLRTRDGFFVKLSYLFRL